MGGSVIIINATATNPNATSTTDGLVANVVGAALVVETSREKQCNKQIIDDIQAR